MGSLTSRIFDFVNSSDVDEQRSGILAIDELIEVHYDDSEPIIVRFANALRILLQQHVDPVVLELAARTLGHLARAGESLTVEIVEFEVKQSLEWLQSHRSEHRRLAAVMVLKELAESTPTLFNVYVSQFLDHIWAAVRDSKVTIRLKAVEALRSCLVDVSKRASSWRLECYHKIFKEAQKGFNVQKYKTSSSIHGSLLVIGELLDTSIDFLRSRFKEVCSTVLGFAKHRESLIRDTVVALMPRLANLARSVFIEEYLDGCVNHLIHTLRKSSERESRETAYLALGELALVVGERLSSKLDILLPLIQMELANGNKKNNVPSEKVLTCVSMLAQAVGPKLANHMKMIVEEMFRSGLSEPLVKSLSKVSSNMQTLLYDIQERLLHAITDILCTFDPERDTKRLKHVDKTPIPLYGCPLTARELKLDLSLDSHTSPVIGPMTPGSQNLGTPSFSITPAKTSTMRSGKKRNASNSTDRSEKDEDLLVLALNTLGSFNFQGRSLLPFTREAVVGFLEDTSPRVRLTAALTCSKILAITPRSVKYHHLTTLVFEVLMRLVTLAIADPDHTIRLAVLESFDERFDRYLSHHELTTALFTSLNDEELKVRETSIALLGRLSNRNPAVVIPYMRKILVRLVSELQQYGLTVQEQEQTCLLVGDVIRAAPSLVRPYVTPLLEILVQKLKSSKENVTSAILSTIGVLSTCGGNEVVGYLGVIIPLIIRTLEDKTSSSRRRAALRTLAQLVSSTGCVIEPYIQHPRLLPTVLNTLTGEPQWSVRNEVYKVLGVLGALDPLTYEAKVESVLEQKAEEEKEKNKQEKIDRRGGIIDEESLALVSQPSANIFPNMLANPEDYFPTIALSALMRILRERSLLQHHALVIKAVMFIFRSLGMRGVPYLPQIIPPFLEEMRVCDASQRENMVLQLAGLVTIVRQHMRNFLGEIFQLVNEFWFHLPLLPSLLQLVEELALAVRDEFKDHLGELIPQMMAVLDNDTSAGHRNSVRILKSIITFSTNGSLEEYLYVIIPELLRLPEQNELPLSVRSCALRTILHLSRSHDISEYASRLLHSFSRLLATPAYSLHSTVVAVICVVVNQLGSAFAIFEPMVTKSIESFRARAYTVKDTSDIRIYTKYVTLISQMRQAIELKQNYRRIGINPETAEPMLPSLAMKGDNVDLNEILDDVAGVDIAESKLDSNGHGDGVGVGSHNKLHVSQQNLKRAWESSQRSTPEDWIEWRRGFSIELLKESPSPALRACSALALKYPPLARELFNSAFLSCWGELYDTYQDDLVHSLEMAIGAKHIPAKIVQALLNLAEYMEHVDKPLPIDPKTLGDLASKWHAYAKALHYKELQFISAPEEAIDDLISINIMLQQPDAAVGILEFAQNHLSIELKESWYEKLERWEDALETYERKQLGHPHSTELTLGRLRCLRALGDWDRLAQLNQQLWATLDEKVDHDETRYQTAHLGFIASWNVGDWESMRQFVSVMNPRSFKGCFGRAVLAIEDSKFDKALEYIDVARQRLDAKLTALVREGYKRCYNAIVRIQQLNELEEVIIYKQSPESRRKALRLMWEKRLEGCKRDVDVWQKIMAIRSLVMTPEEGRKAWIEFSHLCRKCGRLALSLRVLTSLLGMDPMALRDPKVALPENYNPHIIMAALRYLFSAGFHRDAFERLRSLLDSPVFETDEPEIQQLKSHCYVKLGDWQLALMNAENDSDGEENASDMHSGTASPISSPNLSPTFLSPIGTPTDSPRNQKGSSSPTSPRGFTQGGGSASKASSLKVIDPASTAGMRRRSVTFQSDPVVVSIPTPQMRRSRSSSVDSIGAEARMASNAQIRISIDSDETERKERERERERESERGNEIGNESGLRERLRAENGRDRNRSSAASSGVDTDDGDDSDNLSESSIQRAVNRAVQMTEGSNSPVRSRRISQESSNLRSNSPRIGSPKMMMHRRYLSRPSIVVINNYDQVRHQALTSYFYATLSDENNYRAWHAWAVMNFRIVSHYFKTNQKSVISAHLTPAIEGFFKSIALQDKEDSRSLQDILRLLTLWFEHGQRPKVREAVIDGFEKVSVDTWLAVIPQIIARIDTPVEEIRGLVHAALTKIGKVHPQALVFPLIVSSKSKVKSRSSAAWDLLNILRTESPVLLDQAFLVSEELIRIAILWHELWLEAIEEAFRELFTRKNIEKAIEVLLPLHDMMRKGPTTIKEHAFVQMYGGDLDEAEQWLQRYIKSRNRTDLSRATDLYHSVLRKVTKEITTFTESPLNMQMIAKELHNRQDFRLAVPGTYGVGKPLVRISYFIPTLTVIESKQHPRRLSLMGSDGRMYSFLLKGHEDLRQDERVMQLFGLVNTLLANDREASMRNLGIHRYEVIPLSPNSGLAEWVPHCDTIHALIKQYRDSQHIMLNIEQTLMIRMCHDYQHLRPIQKVEVFENALSHTTGQDLCKVLWMKSQNAEIWLERRTNYTRSLAVMSMVGYVLGLGDRHTCNIMIDRLSGKVVHIDFGDCFEVAMHRDKYPEKIPFRLTRMLIRAMEVSGIEGNFRMTCESVMEMMRENKESVMAVLEAFVYDPLINWRLTHTKGKARGAPEEGKAVTDVEKEEGEEVKKEGLNQRALHVIGRVEDKLTGRDFGHDVLEVHDQVEKLISQATSHENLCQCYMGWCPFW